MMTEGGGQNDVINEQSLRRAAILAFLQTKEYSLQIFSFFKIFQIHSINIFQSSDEIIKGSKDGKIFKFYIFF